MKRKLKKFNTHKQQVEAVIDDLQSMMDKLKALEKSFLQHQEALYVISEFANDWEYWKDEEGEYQYVSPSCENITGYTPDDFYEDKNLLQKIIAPRDWHKWQDHNHNVAEDGAVEPIEFEIKTKSGEIKWMHHVCRIVQESSGKNMGIRGSNRDISQIKALQRELKHAAGHDILTGLANRKLLLEHLRQTIKEAKREDSMFVVAFIDLDNFKGINDTYGHDAGDHVLKRVAEDIKRNMRGDDIVARFGGDEFVGLFKISSQDDTDTIKQKILSQINTEIQCYKFAITIQLSIGMSVYPTDGTTYDTLLNLADDEMYAMKARNKSRRQAKKGS